jgi:hypothetical protein
VWQALHTELADEGLTVITVALDASADAARPWVRRAGATHPSLVDTEHRVADLYHVVNVPTVVWIDEAGRIVRPQDVHFVSSEYSAITRFHPRKPTAALRAWVRGEATGYAGDVAADTKVPGEADQEARAAFALAWWLHRQGRTEAAERWFVHAGELAPHDFTIRRGSMPIRGLDPAGPAFFAMTAAWAAAGNAYYLPLPDTATSAEDFEAEPVEALTLEEIRARAAAEAAAAEAAAAGGAEPDGAEPEG